MVPTFNKTAVTGTTDMKMRMPMILAAVATSTTSLPATFPLFATLCAPGFVRRHGKRQDGAVGVTS